jgi:peptidoglycan/xylan/chitin deacetylase (PgdA/CDA1 family)
MINSVVILVTLSSFYSGLNADLNPLTPSNPTVVFRLDDVQSWWCEDIARTVINTFLAENVPVNLGIVGKDLDTSSSMTAYLASLSSNPLVEMTSHSQTHTSFDGKSVSWQRDELRSSIDMINSVTGETASTFITPYNEYDANTAVSMLAEGMTILSASCMWDPVTYAPIWCMDGSDVVAPDIEWNGVYSLPAGAVLGKEAYWNDYQQPASLADAVGWIESQIGKRYFSLCYIAVTNARCVGV